MSLLHIVMFSIVAHSLSPFEEIYEYLDLNINRMQYESKGNGKRVLMLENRDLEEQACDPNYKNDYGSCSDYKAKKWCTSDGKIGSGWKDSWGKSIGGAKACPQCGCKGSGECNPDFKNDYGNCADYKAKKWCTSDGKIGSGWKDSWGKHIGGATVCPQCGCSEKNITKQDKDDKQEDENKHKKVEDEKDKDKDGDKKSRRGKR